MRQTKWFLALLLLWAAPLQAQQLWATWSLDLEGHVPPQAFMLTVTTTQGVAPPPLRLPWASCAAVPGAPHCAPVGCPPAGTYRFWVAAQYAEGLSAPSDIVTCQVDVGQCGCAPSGEPRPTPLPVSLPRVRVQGAQVPPGLVLSREVPTLVPVGAMPTLPPIPPLPTSAGL